MTNSFFQGIAPIKFVGNEISDISGFHHYNPNELVLGKRLEDHLRFAVAYWHSFAWEGGDPFGSPTFERPWHPQDSMENARIKADNAFDTWTAIFLLARCRPSS